jgi:Rieske Fe-S protein
MPEKLSTRRSFLDWFLGTSVGGFFLSIAYPVARYLSPPEIPEAATDQVEAGSTNDPDLLDRGFKIVRFGAEPVIVVRVDEGDFRAFAGTCTHLDCIVEYRRNDRLLWCNCHNGVYDLAGRNIGGPPPRPLDPYRVHVVAKGAGEPGVLVVERIRA